MLLLDLCIRIAWRDAFFLMPACAYLLDAKMHDQDALGISILDKWKGKVVPIIAKTDFMCTFICVNVFRNFSFHSSNDAFAFSAV